ncbi:hypothetical protein CG747_37005 [Streptomyces sp. CB02959]|nr:hypothetical protein CG747_37005 [Streptomyces sp. CB02959]
MGAWYYCADSENGDHIGAPSEAALFMLIDDLNDTDNTFVVIQPDDDGPAWFTSVAVQDEGGYELYPPTNVTVSSSGARPVRT